MSKDPVILYVTYQGSAATRFDRDYYVETHMKLVRDAFTPHGLESAAAFFPAEDVPGTIAICELRFRDEAALEASFSSAQAPGVMADVPHFTDATPARVRIQPG